MPTMMFRRLTVAAIALVLLGASRPAHAEFITFDGTITSPIPPSSSLPGFTLNYVTPVPPGGPVALFTQGFAFGGATNGVTGAGNTTPTLNLVLDSTLCPAFLGIPCVSNGSRVLAATDPFSLQRQGGRFLGLLGF